MSHDNSEPDRTEFHCLCQVQSRMFSVQNLGRHVRLNCLEMHLFFLSLSYILLRTNLVESFQRSEWIYSFL